MAYDVKTWAKVKADYESGNFSVEKLGKKWGISDTAIENKIAEDGWIKGKNREKIEMGIAERNIAMFAKLGMTQEKVAEKMLEGILLPEATEKKLAEYLKNEDGNKTDDFYKSVTTIVKELVNDRYLSLKYIQELNKMCGSLAPTKKEVTGEGGKDLIPRMSKEQLLDKLRNMIE